MRIYATAGELGDYVTSLGVTLDLSTIDGIDGRLSAASAIVGRETRGAWYDTDDAGMPTDATKLAAFRDATCAQVLAWITLNVAPEAGGVYVQGKTAAQIGIGSASKRYMDAQAASDARAAILQDLVPDAVEILRQAGLITTRAWSYG